MANAVGKNLGKVFETVAEVQSNEIFTSPLNKGWRAKILLNRATSPMDKVSQNVGKKEDDINKHYAIPKSYSTGQRVHNPWKSKQISGEERGLSKQESIEAFAIDHTTQNKNKRADFRHDRNEVIIVNSSVSPAIYLTLQNRPNELDFDNQSYWTSIKSMGRNNPFQIYTGSEDTLNLEITWYSNEGHREDVINKCRLLESWAKGDGYQSSPPVLQIIWGNSGIFDNVDFILYSAPYKLTHFQDAVRTKAGDIKNLKLLPNHATQKLSFKRVSRDNLRHQDIITQDKLRNTSGIKL